MYTADITPWTTDETVQLPVNQWQFPDKDIYFFCDLHADAEAFLRSLQASFLVTTDSRLDNICLTTQGQHAQIVIGGDCFDKGPSNLALFRLIGLLRQQNADLILLAGNHDIRVYAGLSALDFKQDPYQSHFFARMGRKTAALFAEIHREHCQNAPLPDMDENAIIEHLFPNEEWFNRFPQHARAFMSEEKIQKEIRQIRFKQQDFLEACRKHGLNLTQVYQAVEKARELFIDANGEFSWFFQEIKLLHSSGSYLFCHAGLDDTIAKRVAIEPVDRLNRDFQQQLDRGKLFEIYYSEFGNVFRTKYRTSDKPLTILGTQALKQAGIYALVNGHRSHKNGQQLFIRNGLLNFECDTQINENCRKKNKISTLGYSSTIFFANGLVSAMSSDIPKAKMFHPKHLKKA